MREDFAELALERASELGARYSDIRFVDGERRLVSVKNGKPEKVTHTSESGFGVRLLINNGWGFAGTYKISEDSVKEMVERAAKVARSSSRVSDRKIELTPVRTVEDTHESDVKIDPLEVPVEEILELLVDGDKSFRDNCPHAKTTNSRIHSRMEDKYLATSENSRIKQRIVFCGGMGQGYAVRNGQVQRRSWEINPQTRGFEYIKEFDVNEMAAKAGREAEELLSAEPCPEEVRKPLILDDPHLYLQIHETIGHGSELDRVLGTEVDLAGMSFLKPDKLGAFRYGSDQVNFTADPTIEHGLGSYGYDDEGVPAREVYLVKDGILCGYQSSRETAAQIGLEQSSSGMRAASPIDLPLVRMNNINLLPGDWKKDEIIEDTKDGILMRTTKMWSIDQRRLNFQFGTEIGWKVEDGELTEMIRDPTYTGISYEFWRKLDATAEDDWTMYGTTGCGKGRPGQSMYVGHGAATTRIDDVRIGVSGGQ